MDKLKNEVLSVRVTSELSAALERECRRIGRVGGAEVKPSAVIRACLEKALLGKKRARAA